MTDFRDMTPAELEKSMADDLYRFIMEHCPTRDPQENCDRITGYLYDFSQHIETVAHPLTEAQKAARMSARIEWVPKTAWGWLSMLRMQNEEIDAREPIPMEGAKGIYKINVAF
ncbi:hypothetical protein ABC766_00435 [Methylobacterium fujisawaense]|jgi:hypothetical protein|uniref:hypothetical protein n=2 Tax=Pseudomonadota TaxID=1224 RepID=UPI0031F5350A